MDISLAAANTTSAVIQYTPGEHMKIIACGAVLVIAILVITYALYKKITVDKDWHDRTVEYNRRVENDEDTSDLEELPPPQGVSKFLLWILGAAIVLIGIIIYFIPS